MSKKTIADVPDDVKRQLVNWATAVQMVEAIRHLQAEDPFMLAALIDFIRQEWKGGDLPPTDTVMRWVDVRKRILKDEGIAAAGKEQLAAAVAA